MNLSSSGSIHKIFLNYIFLNEIEKFPEGISGYRLRKTMNNIFKNQKNENIPHFPQIFSQSLVYREFKMLKKAGFLDSRNVTIKNRHQILYTINEKGKKQLAQLRKIIQNFAPIDTDPRQFAEGLFTGKINPLDLLPRHLSKDELLSLLKSIRMRMTNALEKINAKIAELEKISN
ncbi:MAG: hypothetical protein ACTSRS_10160 [Candidatus Helarchaeota archaeon]